MSRTRMEPNSFNNWFTLGVGLFHQALLNATARDQTHVADKFNKRKGQTKVRGTDNFCNRDKLDLIRVHVCGL